MRRIARIVAAAACCASISASLTTAFGLPPASAAEPTSGQCHVNAPLGPKKGSNLQSTASCEGPHLSETFFVGSLPASFPDPAKASAKQIAAVRASNCTVQRMNAYMGLNSPVPSRFRPVALFPNSVEYAAGDRWIRCDLVYSSGLSLGEMPKPAAQWVGDNVADLSVFNYCTPGVGYSKMPSPTKTSAQQCTNPSKQWVLVSRPTVGSIGQKYPGSRSLNSKAAAKCKGFKNTYSGGIKDPYSRGWSYIYPMAKGWTEGVRTVTCWVPLKQYVNSK